MLSFEKKIPENFCMSSSVQLRLLAVFAFIRFWFALAQRSAFHADEFWQGPEVAYRLVFGSTETTWEWYDTVALRSHLHPLMFAAFYKLVALASLDYPDVIAHGPRVLQGLLNAFGDVAFYLLVKKLYGSKVAAYGVTSYITTWYSIFTLSRTTSNSAEAVLTLLGLYFLFVRNSPVYTASAAADRLCECGHQC